jgi:hypothetical protein
VLAAGRATGGELQEQHADVDLLGRRSGSAGLVLM